ncbi:hypothetical protein GGX14DRAFT_394089 [Mycena pura]|uniref:Uncharacterized protein n=1 Tax=Mycena pura TaxID=153505 RepID=A0AAD6VG97_9AGAR|nr:hypothetical protein GGX14DRAFT_394089 [Mycena pura]
MPVWSRSVLPGTSFGVKLPGVRVHFGHPRFLTSATMSTTSPKAKPLAASPIQTTHRRSQSASTSNSDWLGPSLLAARAMTAASDSAPFPYVRGVFATVVVVLESIEKVQRNRDGLKYLCGNVIEIMKIVQSHVIFHEDSTPTRLEDLCTEFER